MNDRELRLFHKLATIDICLMIVVPIIWTIIFWNSPLLTINVLLPILIGAAYCLPALVFIFFKLVFRR